MMKLFAVCLIVGAFAAAAQAICVKMSLNSQKFELKKVPSPGLVKSMALVKQRSRSACALKKSYGHTKTYLWVSKGCRAVFRVCYIPDATCTKISLDSKKSARQEKPSPGQIKSMRMVKERSESACVLNKSYGHSFVDLWVDKGCQATFEVCYTPVTKLKVLCESKSLKKKVCPVGASILTIAVRRRAPKSSCVEGIGYRVEGSDIIVSHGCRAIFEVWVH